MLDVAHIYEPEVHIVESSGFEMQLPVGFWLETFHEAKLS